MESRGATLYCGLLNIEDGYTMRQTRDPWGNCIGIAGLKSQLHVSQLPVHQSYETCSLKHEADV